MTVKTQETKTVVKKEIKLEQKVDAKKEPKKEIKSIYVVDYYIKDLTMGKVIESNVKSNNPSLFFNGEKVILEGVGSAFKKVEEKLRALKVGGEFFLVLEPKEAYGVRKAELLRVIATSDFRDNKINPFVGLQINADGRIGTVKSVTGGRVLVDFNSPFADHKIEVYYKLKSIPIGKDKIDRFISAALPKEKIKDYSIEKKDKDTVVKINFANLRKEEEPIYLGLLKATVKYYFEESIIFQ
jgi:peptidylprolyl isomerase